jgi:Ni,Fe-hydrogenase III large subunit/NADH:ubiquinone oxidoreductase subunit C
MKHEKHIELMGQPARVKMEAIPVLPYTVFSLHITELLREPYNHCLNYFVVPFPDRYKFMCCIANDEAKSILLFSHEHEKASHISLPSLTRIHFPFHLFEREIHENFGIEFPDHPWLKPIRYPANRHDKGKIMDSYPFYSMEGEELHEVGVGPVHAGVIEPGHFRFICNGEKVLHLEIQLGYQHRGVESLFVKNESSLKNSLLAECIAGDTAIGHSVCHAGVMEALAGLPVSGTLALERTIALEMERIAVHIGDTAALCTDVAYQFGQVVNEALRTIVINTMQGWCGNRFGKGLVRSGGTRYPLTPATAAVIRKNLQEIRLRYGQITGHIFSMSSVLGRFEATGRVTAKQASLIGAVGMAARSSGLKRDIRWSHPSLAYSSLNFEPVVISRGDVWARAMMRKSEVEQSIDLVFHMLDLLEGKNDHTLPVYNDEAEPDAFSISVTEGWRGEICHTAITGENGKIMHYKVKDPSLHNWMALALAVRGQEISDFPLCNKSFNLSYCGNDL